jgi:hypothetical protein
MLQFQSRDELHCGLAPAIEGAVGPNILRPIISRPPERSSSPKRRDKEFLTIVLVEYSGVVEHREMKLILLLKFGIIDFPAFPIPCTADLGENSVGAARNGCRAGSWQPTRKLRLH